MRRIIFEMLIQFMTFGSVLARFTLDTAECELSGLRVKMSMIWANNRREFVFFDKLVIATIGAISIL